MLADWPAMLVDWSAIALGGAVGSLLRYALTKLAVAVPGGSTHFGTLAANILGCLAMGVLVGAVTAGGMISDRHHLAIRVGLLGGLTTFSSFAIETVLLVDQNRSLAASAYLLANVVFSLGAVLAGMGIGRAWVAS